MKSPPPDLPDTDDPWKILDLAPGASPAEIRRAYLRLIKIYKPDRHPQAFRRIREAFDALWVDDRVAPPDTSGWGDDESPPPADSIEEGWGRTAAPGEPPREPVTPRRSDRDRTETLLDALEAAIAADDRDGAVAMLLQPEHAPLANDPRVADAVVRIACSVVLSQPDRFDELAAAYRDILLERSLEHREGILVHMRDAARQWPAWQRATADAPELSRFVELAGTLVDAKWRAVGLEVHARAQADPAAFLARLDRIERDAPALLDLYTRLAEAWVSRFGRARARGGDASAADDIDAAARGDAEQPTTRATIVQGLESLLVRNEVLSRAKLRRLLLNAATIAAVVWLSPAYPLLIGAAALALLSLVHALALDPTERIYREILRPALAVWAWQGHDLDAITDALRSLVDRQPIARRILEPDTPSEYPKLLSADHALQAHARTSHLR